MCWPADIEFLYDFHSLIEKRQLFLLNLLENCDTALGVDELHAVHLVKELDNCVLLFQLLEPHDRLLPVVVVHLKLGLVGSDYVFVECIALKVLFSVFDLITLFEINHNLVNCRL